MIKIIYQNHDFIIIIQKLTLQKSFIIIFIIIEITIKIIILT